VSAVRRAVSTTAVDVSPLRESRQFRLLFIGQTVSFAGTMITYVAIPFQAYALTRSSLVVGLVSLTELAPILLMSFVGGALADAVDRRRMVRLTELGLCAVVAVLVVNAALPHPQPFNGRHSTRWCRALSPGRSSLRLPRSIRCAATSVRSSDLCLPASSSQQSGCPQPSASTWRRSSSVWWRSA
jgi:hypothetical protein